MRPNNEPPAVKPAFGLLGGQRQPFASVKQGQQDGPSERGSPSRVSAYNLFASPGRISIPTTPTVRPKKDYSPNPMWGNTPDSTRGGPLSDIGGDHFFTRDDVNLESFFGRRRQDDGLGVSDPLRNGLLTYPDPHSHHMEENSILDQGVVGVAEANLPEEQESSEASASEDEQAPLRHTKGLKSLSVAVRDIVIQRETTTYKDVAEIILRDTLRSEVTPDGRRADLGREEQNIKRRVYDALNVLISAGVLIKEGKRVRRNDGLLKDAGQAKRTEISSRILHIVT